MGILFVTSFMYPDLDPKPFEAIPNPDADTAKVIHDSQNFEPTPKHHVVKISDGLRIFDNSQPGGIHNVADHPDLTTVHGIMWIISGLFTVWFSFKSVFTVYMKFKPKMKSRLYDYLKSNSFS